MLTVPEIHFSNQGPEFDMDTRRKYGAVYAVTANGHAIGTVSRYTDGATTRWLARTPANERLGRTGGGSRGEATTVLVEDARRAGRLPH